MTFSSLSRAIPIICTLLCLAGCFTPPKEPIEVARFRAASGQVALMESLQVGGYFFRFLDGPYAGHGVVLKELSKGRVTVVANPILPEGPVVVVRDDDPTGSCPVRYEIVSLRNPNEVTAFYGGDCKSDFDFTPSPDGTMLMGKQVGAADPQLYAYKNRQLYGPIRYSVVMAQNAQKTAQHRPQRPTPSPVRSATQKVSPRIYPPTSTTRAASASSNQGSAVSSSTAPSSSYATPVGVPAPPDHETLSHVDVDAIPPEEIIDAGASKIPPILKLDD